MAKFEKQIIRPTRIDYYTVMPVQTINGEYDNQTGTCTITAKVSGLEEREAYTIMLIAKRRQDDVIKQIVQNTKKESSKHKEGIKISPIPILGLLGIFVVGGLLVKLRLPKDKEPTEIVQEYEPQTITLYAVSSSKSVFEYMGDLEEFQGRYETNVATLRGVQTLTDEDFKKYDEDIKMFNTYIDKFKQNGDVDLNEFINIAMRVYDCSFIAADDLNTNRNNPEEENNKEIIFNNYLTASIIKDKSKYICENAEEALQMKYDYPQSSLYSIPEGYAYGIKEDDIRIFSTLEEATQYQETISEEFDSHLKSTPSQDVFYDGHDYIFTLETDQYEAQMTKEELKEAIKSGKTYSLTKTKIDGNFKTNFGK